jgi:hypothetical protein
VFSHDVPGAAIPSFVSQALIYLRAAPDGYVRGWGVLVFEGPNRFVFYCYTLGSMDDAFLLLL